MTAKLMMTVFLPASNPNPPLPVIYVVPSHSNCEKLPQVDNELINSIQLNKLIHLLEGKKIILNEINEVRNNAK